MQGIKLRDPSTSEPFFPVNNDIVLPQSRPPIVGTTRSFMGESIVPIVAKVAGETDLRCIGTGFFVSCTGLLITAAHVITDPIERSYGTISRFDDGSLRSPNLIFGALVPTNPIFQEDGYLLFAFEWAMFLADDTSLPLPIPGLGLNISSDIAICKVPARAGPYPHQPLTMIQSGVAPASPLVQRSARWDMGR